MREKLHFLLGFIGFVAFIAILVCLATAIIGYAPRPVLITFVLALIVMVAVGVYFITTMIEDERAPDPLGADNRPIDVYRASSLDDDLGGGRGAAAGYGH